MNKYNKEGLREGLWEVYIDGRLCYNGTYVNGKKHGVFEYYHSNGNLSYKENYINGKECGLREGYYLNVELIYKEYQL